MHILLAIALILPPAVAAADKPVVTAAELNAPDDLVRAMDVMFVTMTTPGDGVADWQEKGIDLLAQLRGARSGLDGTILANDAPGDRWVRYLGGSRLAVPESFVEVLTLPGAPMQGEVGFQDMSEIVDGIWLRTSGRLQRRGNALCGKGWESMALLAQRGAALSGDAQIAVMAMRQLMTRMREVETCVVMVEQADGSLLERSYLPDGRTLPAIDVEATPAKLRPFTDAAAIIKP